MLYVWSRREFSTAIERSSVAGIQRVPLIRSMRSIAARGAQREPEAAVAREALLRREVVDVERARVDAHAARGRRAVDDDERVAARAGARRRSRRSTSRCAGTRRRRRRPGRGASGVSPGAVSQTCGSSRCGAARVTCGELRRELADHEVRAAPLDEPERRRVPEERRAADAEQHLVAVGEREEVGETAADAARRPTARRRGGGSCRGSRARRRRARRRPRRAPSTDRIRTAVARQQLRAEASDRSGVVMPQLYGSGQRQDLVEIRRADSRAGRRDRAPRWCRSRRRCSRCRSARSARR